MRVLVTGGRDYNDAAVVQRTLEALRPHPAFVIQGGALGADLLARGWAKPSGVAVLNYPADWQTYGRRAGPLRNQRMIDEGKPDLVVAFPGGRGTADMVKRARNAGIPVREVGDPATPRRDATDTNSEGV